MLPCHDVLNVKGNERRGLLWYAATLAGISSARSNELPKAGVHLSWMPGEKLAGLCLYNRDQVDSFHKILVLCILRCRERPVVSLLAQFGNAGFQIGDRIAGPDSLL